MTQTQVEKHCGTMLKFRLDTFRTLFEDLNEDQSIELIKSLIWTSADNHAMYDRVKKEILSPKFESTLD